MNNIEPGDVVFSSSSSVVSYVIAFVTRSEFSHVAIAINKKGILETTKNGIVAVVPFDEFCRNKRKVLVAKRPEKLNGDEIASLNRFVARWIGRPYSVVNAISSMALHMYVFLVLTLDISLILYFYPLVGLKIFSIVAYYLVFHFLQGIVMLYASRRRLGVDWTEQALSRSNIGKRIIEKRRNPFCATLVWDADKELKGEICRTRSAAHRDEVRPGDIARACIQELKYKTLKLK